MRRFPLVAAFFVCFKYDILTHNHITARMFVYGTPLCAAAALPHNRHRRTVCVCVHETACARSSRGGDNDDDDDDNDDNNDDDDYDNDDCWVARAKCVNSYGAIGINRSPHPTDDVRYDVWGHACVWLIFIPNQTTQEHGRKNEWSSTREKEGGLPNLGY